MMRVIAGSARSVPLKAPAGDGTRPTTDRIKETLFNILQRDVPGCRFLDLFAGTGNISYEFAARGALSVLSVDIHQQCVQFMNRTANALQFENMRAVKADALSYIGHCMQQFNVIFADPPYDWEQYDKIPELVFGQQLLLPDGFLVIEHPHTQRFDTLPHFFQHRSYGKVNFSFFAENL